jgi:hypothetical protein
MDPDALAAEILREFNGGTIVVCGHSDTVGQLAHALGCPGGVAKIGEFNLIWVLRIGPDGFLSIEERHQMAPAP